MKFYESLAKLIVGDFKSEDKRYIVMSALIRWSSMEKDLENAVKVWALMDSSCR